MSLSVCDKCFHVFDRSSLVDCYCPIHLCEGEIIELDERIYEAFVIFNNKGYNTLASCSGHSFSKIDDFSPYICFKNNRLMEKVSDTLYDYQSFVNELTEIGRCDNKISKKFIFYFLASELIKGIFTHFDTIINNNNFHLLDVDDFNKTYKNLENQIKSISPPINISKILINPIFTLRIGINIPNKFYAEYKLHENDKITSIVKKAEILNEWNVQLLKFATIIDPCCELLKNIIDIQRNDIVDNFVSIVN